MCVVWCGVLIGGVQSFYLRDYLLFCISRGFVRLIEWSLSRHLVLLVSSDLLVFPIPNSVWILLPPCEFQAQIPDQVMEASSSISLSLLSSWTSKTMLLMLKRFNDEDGGFRSCTSIPTSHDSLDSTKPTYFNRSSEHACTHWKMHPTASEVPDIDYGITGVFWLMRCFSIVATPINWSNDRAVLYQPLPRTRILL